MVAEGGYGEEIEEIGEGEESEEGEGELEEGDEIYDPTREEDEKEYMREFP